MEANSRSRILFLLKYLMEKTDEKKQATTPELCEEYKLHNFGGYRKTVKDDAKVLIDAGFNVIITSQAGKTDTYYIVKNDFEPPEVKMLLDAVASAKFLSEGKCTELIDKLLNLTGCSRSKVMTREGHPARFNTEANRIFCTIDMIEDAIESGHKITFQYYDYDMELNRILHNNGEVYTFSPYSFKWDQDRYYILGTVDKRPGIINPFRIDLICNVKITEVKITPPPKEYQSANFCDKVFKMYGGQKADVVMEADAKLVKKFIDRFGDKFKSEAISETRFRATVTVEVSPTFYAWVFQYNGGINIVGPENVRDEYLAMLRKATQNMLGTEQVKE